jgi:hypothetical protein
MSELPVWSLPYVSENYTGPYLSNGQLQSSVAFGDVDPKSQLDVLSRLHDTAYATYSDFGHRTAADAIYDAEAKKLEALFPQLAGSIVLYGNQLERSLTNLVSGMYSGPLGFIVGAAKNMYNLNDYMINEKRYKAEVNALYASDPYKPVVKDVIRMPQQIFIEGPQEMLALGKPDVFDRAVERYEHAAGPFPEYSVGTEFSPVIGYRRKKHKRKRRMEVV